MISSLEKYLDVNSYITSISPLKGSVYGGTIITITGGPFSNNGLENNVKVGNTDCLVTRSERLPALNSFIICELQPKADGLPATETLEVFLKAYEMAVCSPPGSCEFTWTDEAT